jgi:hypothetical protein
MYIDTEEKAHEFSAAWIREAEERARKHIAWARDSHKGIAASYRSSGLHEHAARHDRIVAVFDSYLKTEE